MKKDLRACKKCKTLTEERNCPIHGDEKTSDDWYGFLMITEPGESTIAHKADIERPGMYAIKVRQ